MRAFRIVLWTAFFGLIAFTAFAQNPKMLKDIYPGTTGTYYVPGAILNGWYYFSANNGTNGTEMWKTDLTSQNTAMVKDINPGSGHGSGASYIVNSNGTLYFPGDNGGGTGEELWKSDGTLTGTVLVKDIWPGSSGKKGINRSLPIEFTYMNGYTYFRAYHGWHQNYPISDLYRTNGTSAGTTLVKALNRSNFGGAPTDLIVLNNILYFFAFHDGYEGKRLTRSDGTSSGTILVYPDAATMSETITRDPIIVNDILYFRADDGVNGEELHRSDGTRSGSWMVKNINPSGSSSPNFFVQFNGMIFFTASDGAHGTELWKSDGTESGTVMVADINPDGSSNPYWLTPVENTLFFTAIGPSTDDPASAKTRQLWKSDGTAQGTVRVAMINSSGDCEPAYNVAPYPAYHSNALKFPVVSGKIYFRATDGQNGIELWTSDGTAAGTFMVKDIYSGSTGSIVKWLKPVNNQVIFVANHPSYGDELWVFDPSAPISKESAAPEMIPTAITLKQNYPNPFGSGASAGSSTIIEYAFPGDCDVSLRVYDMLGRKVATLADGMMPAGQYRVAFAAEGLPSGTYTYRLEAGGKALIRMMRIVK